LALVGFTVFPVMPPRLLPPGYHFVDTLKTVGGLWSFDSGPVSKVSNQFAAMPSLHMAWSMWCGAVLAVTVRRPWARTTAIAYPTLTLFCIIVTANHYFLDAIAGVITLGLGFVIALALRSIEEATRRSRTRLDTRKADPEVTAARDNQTRPMTFTNRVR
jgi:membrane-associated phospholipid phosphatase